MIIYYSGTGNSRYCAEKLAEKLGDEVVDAFAYMRDGIAAEFFSGKPWVFVAPTYAWQLPRIFQDFIRSGSFQGSEDAYFVLTCGSEIGNASASIRKLCEEKGLRFRGTLEVKMPENYIALFNVPEREEAKAIILGAEPLLQSTADKILKGETLAEPKHGIIDKLKSGPVDHAFYKLVIRAKPFYATDACVGCGKCVSACVLKNIHLVDGKPRWGEDCTHCMACICGCPVEAIEYGRASKGKPRYLLEKYIDR